MTSPFDSKTHEQTHAGRHVIHRVIHCVTRCQTRHVITIRCVTRHGTCRVPRENYRMKCSMTCRMRALSARYAVTRTAKNRATRHRIQHQTQACSGCPALCASGRVGRPHHSCAALLPRLYARRGDEGAAEAPRHRPGLRRPLRRHHRLRLRRPPLRRAEVVLLRADDGARPDGARPHDAQPAHGLPRPEAVRPHQVQRDERPPTSVRPSPPLQCTATAPSAASAMARKAATTVSGGAEPLRQARSES
jgi:hypothetical protein